MNCIYYPEAVIFLKELHERPACNYSGGRNLAFRAYIVGYYWLTMRTDAAELVKKCEKCQRHANYLNLPA